MPKITTTELVNIIFSFCQIYSGVEFFPYQAQFGKRIIRSVLENDGDEITALFSRQCITEDSQVLMGDKTLKSIKDIKEGEEVLAFDYNTLVPRKVISSYKAGKREIYRLKLKSGCTIECTANHRFLDFGSRLFKPLFNFEAGDEIAYLDKTGKIKFSRIDSIIFMGEKETYDLEVDSAENYIANNILVHNSGKSETVATISGGLAIILPTLANIPMFAEDKRLRKFRDGFLIGIFAPSFQQAQISFNRMKTRMGSIHAQKILNDPEINLKFDVSNGENIRLSNGSLIRCQSASDGANIEGGSYMLIIVDEAQDVGNFKYSKSISPMGAFYNATKILIGTPTTHRGFFYEAIERNKKEYENGGRRNHFEYDYKTIIKYNPNYEKYIEGEKKRLGEYSDEFQMSYNLKWVLERGMFVTGKLFDKLADRDRGIVLSDWDKYHVAGIDLGKKQDSTVITVLEVDWDNPIVIEAKEAGIPDYVAYHVYIKAWKEIQGDDWNKQFDIIVNFLSNYNIVKVVIDATGVGDAIYDRLRVTLDCEVEPFVYSKQSKSDLYKHLNSEFRAERVHYPANEETRETIEYQKFVQQFLDLEKTYSGQLMVVSHPEVAGARDDFPDSLALAVWGAKGDGLVTPITEAESIYKTSNNHFIRARNSFTARRR